MERRCRCERESSGKLRERTDHEYSVFLDFDTPYEGEALAAWSTRRETLVALRNDRLEVTKGTTASMLSVDSERSWYTTVICFEAQFFSISCTYRAVN
jgi:hypothetical protein